MLRFRCEEWGGHGRQQHRRILRRGSAVAPADCSAVDGEGRMMSPDDMKVKLGLKRSSVRCHCQLGISALVGIPPVM